MTTPNFPNSGFIQILGGGGGAAPPNTPLRYRPDRSLSTQRPSVSMAWKQTMSCGK